MSKQLRSIEHLADSGTVKVGCGHEIDVRSIVYVHYPDRTETACSKCTKNLPDWKGKA